MTTLTELELTALHTLADRHQCQPHELVRYDGALYIRYMTQFWRVVDGQLTDHSGAFPNRALHVGVIRVEVVE